VSADAWSFSGEDYRLQWDAARGCLSLQWGDLLAFPLLLPLAGVARAGHAAASSRTPSPSPATLSAILAHGGQAQKQPRLPPVSWTGLDNTTPPVFRDHLLLAGEDGAQSGAGGLGWRVECLPHRLLFDASYANPLPHDLRLLSLLPFAGQFRILRGTAADWRFYKSASNTSLPCGSVALDASERNFGIRFVPQVLIPGVIRRMLTLPHESVRFRRGAFSSQWFTLLTCRGGGPCLLIGFLGTARHFSTISLDVRHQAARAVAHAEGCLLAPGERFHAHRLVILMGRSAHACMETYLEEFAASLAPRFRPASLWGSWYAGFYDRFQWPDLQENLEAAASCPAKLEFFQLDDGYQQALGDWTRARACLPEGLEGFARQVCSRGMKPGLWLAPFAVGRDSSLFLRHPDWVVKTTRGRPALAGLMPGRFRLRPYYGLDLTRPEAREWLRELFSTLVSWGFRLFKLDFLASGTIPGIRSDPRMTSAQAYATGLQVIREAVGEIPILGALAPQLAGVGFMDMQRVSPDSSFGGNHWALPIQRWLGDYVTPGLRNNIRNNLTRVSCGDRLWTSDCDAILCGGLSEQEQRTHLAVNLLLGGVFQVGFDLRKEGYPWHEIARLRGYRHRLRRVPDLFETEIPEEALLLSEDARGQQVLLVLLLNLGDAPAEKTLRDPEQILPVRQVRWELAREFWSRSNPNLSPGQRVRLAPRDSLLLELPLDMGNLK